MVCASWIGFSGAAVSAIDCSPGCCNGCAVSGWTGLFWRGVAKCHPVGLGDQWMRFRDQCNTGAASGHGDRVQRNGNDSAEVDIRLEVPSNEGPGNKSALVIFSSGLAE